MEYKQIVPEKLYAKISDFFDSKDKSDFTISQNSESSTLVEYTGAKADPNSTMKLFIYEDHCDFEFQNIQNLTITLNYNDSEFGKWMSGNAEYGTELAHQFQIRYNEIFEARINENADTAFDEDFQVYFLGSFVNYILNETIYED
jgi:hypothetical protein